MGEENHPNLVMALRDAENSGFDFHLQEFLMMVDGICEGESWVPLYDLTPSLMPLGLSQAKSRSTLEMLNMFQLQISRCLLSISPDAGAQSWFRYRLVASGSLDAPLAASRCSCQCQWAPVEMT